MCLSVSIDTYFLRSSLAGMGTAPSRKEMFFSGREVSPLGSVLPREKLGVISTQNLPPELA